MNIAEPLDRDERLELFYLFSDEIDKYRIQRDKLVREMTGQKYRTFTPQEQKTQDAQTLKEISERIDVLRRAGSAYANQYIPAEPFDDFLVKTNPKKAWLQ